MIQTPSVPVTLLDLIDNPADRTAVVLPDQNPRMPISIERLAGAEKVGAHKTSMLQDLEAGRPMEPEAVVGAVVEPGERLGVPMPATQAV